MAVSGLVLAIIGVVSSIVGFGIPALSIAGLPIAILGLILSVVGGKRNPSGIATAGLVIGIIATVFTAITFFTCGLCVLCATGVAMGL